MFLESVMDIDQAPDGLWRWRAPAADGLPGDWSLLAFRTLNEADADSRLHAAAPRDATGRRILGKDYLRRLISAAALPCAHCEDVYFGGVYWHPRDAAGANWDAAIMSGHGDRAACAAAIQSVKDDLRRRFAIVDEA